MHRQTWIRFSCFFLALATVTSTGIASDWLRFRGPNGAGISPDSTPTPTTWSPGENVKWKVALPGAGVSCPIIVGDRVFVTCYTGYGLERQNPGSQEDLKRSLVCVNRSTGNIEWQKTVAAVLPEDPYSGMGVPEHGYASHTPVSDGKHVFAFFGKSGVYAYDLDGNEIWHADVGKDSDPRTWGSSSSPILHGNVVIVPAGAEARAIIGLDAGTGKELWRPDSDGLGNVWGTPVAARIDDERTDIVIGAPYEIWGLNPETGKLRWYCEAMETDQFNSSVVVSNGLIFAIEGRGGGSIAIKTGGKGDITKTHVAWTGRDSNRFGTPAVYDGRIYFISNKVVNCIDAATGEKIYQGRLQGSPAVGRDNDQGEEQPGGGQPDGGSQGRGGFGGGRGGFGGSDYSSPIIADGKLYYTTRNGDMYVIKAGDTFEQVSANRVTADAEDFSATPAVSDGELFFRSNKHLYCVSAK